VLVAPRVLAQHALAEEQQHEQTDGERRLHHHERRQQQREHLQRPPQHRQSRAEQPAGTLQQADHERRSQVMLAGRLLGIHRLQGDP
jgi:hypothetical protein